jgi:hypothetical protein
MTGIVERLRIEADEIRKDVYPRWKNADETMDAAADEIEALHKLLKQMNEALEWARPKLFILSQEEALVKAALQRYKDMK